MKKWRVGSSEGRKSLAEVKIQRDMFNGNTLSTLVFVIAMKPLNHIFSICTRGNKLHKSQKKINHLMYMDDSKLFDKNEKRIGNLNTDRENIQSGYRDGIWHRKICHANNEKRKTTSDERCKTMKSRKKSEHSEKRKITCTWEYWKRKPSNKWRWRKNN